MKSKLLALVLIAGGSLFAQVSFCIRIGRYTDRGAAPHEGGPGATGRAWPWIFFCAGLLVSGGRPLQVA